jgi:hypothetical protein
MKKNKAEVLRLNPFQELKPSDSNMSLMKKRKLKDFYLFNYLIVPMAFRLNGQYSYAFMALDLNNKQNLNKHKQFLDITKNQFRKLISNKYNFNKICKWQEDRIKQYLTTIT